MDKYNMIIQQFIDKYIGKTKGYPTDADYNGECLSLVKLYIKEIHGINPPPSGTNSAYGYWTNFPNPLGTVFTKVEYKDGVIAKKGWIAIWKPTIGNKYGHIDIVVKDGDQDFFSGFDQNWNGRQAHLVSHNYENIEGFLAPKETMADTIQLDKATFEKLVKNSTAYDSLVAEGISQPQDIQKMRDTTNEYRTQMEKAQQEAKACRDELTLMKQEVAGKLGSTQDLPRILGAIDEIIGTMDQLTRKAKDSDEAIRQYEVTVMDLKAEVARLQLLLKANNSLSQASMYEMLLELFNRIVKILKVS